jgi:hypothetical protein
VTHDFRPVYAKDDQDRATDSVPGATGLHRCKKCGFRWMFVMEPKIPTPPFPEEVRKLTCDDVVVAKIMES